MFISVSPCASAQQMINPSSLSTGQLPKDHNSQDVCAQPTSFLLNRRTLKFSDNHAPSRFYFRIGGYRVGQILFPGREWAQESTQYLLHSDILDFIVCSRSFVARETLLTRDMMIMRFYSIAYPVILTILLFGLVSVHAEVPSESPSETPLRALFPLEVRFAMTALFPL